MTLTLYNPPSTNFCLQSFNFWSYIIACWRHFPKDSFTLCGEQNVIGDQDLAVNRVSKIYGNNNTCNNNNNNLYSLHESIHIKHLQSNITYNTI